MKTETVNKLNEKLLKKDKEIQILKSSITTQKKEMEQKIKELDKHKTKLQLESQGFQIQLDNIKKIKTISKFKIAQTKGAVKSGDQIEVVDKIIKDLVQMTKVDEHIEYL